MSASAFTYWFIADFRSWSYYGKQSLICKTIWSLYSRLRDFHKNHGMALESSDMIESCNHPRTAKPEFYVRRRHQYGKVGKYQLVLVRQYLLTENKAISFATRAVLFVQLKVMHYLCSEDLPKSFSQLIEPTLVVGNRRFWDNFSLATF